MKHTELVKKLFAWNSKNLVQGAHLKKSDLAIYFADKFLVIANGKTYDANHDNYFEFLNQFRSSIRSIDYVFGDLIADKGSVAIPLKARIIRTDDTLENFDAILILKFDANDKIVLWHEIYIKL